ncbi:MAG: hypothetical protein Q7K57_59745 [Burkholderiaceae bacterium]|nr:hypothetical protein [Burkholderiaceae bacterium]
MHQERGSDQSLPPVAQFSCLIIGDDDIDRIRRTAQNFDMVSGHGFSVSIFEAMRISVDRDRLRSARHRTLQIVGVATTTWQSKA